MNFCFSSFFYVHVTREKLLKWLSYKIFVHKMLMKLTLRRIFAKTKTLINVKLIKKISCYSVTSLYFFQFMSKQVRVAMILCSRWVQLVRQILWQFQRGHGKSRLIFNNFLPFAVVYLFYKTKEKTTWFLFYPFFKEYLLLIIRSGSLYLSGLIVF